MYVCNQSSVSVLFIRLSWTNKIRQKLGLILVNKVFQKSKLFLICFWIFSAHKLTYLTLAKSLLKSYEMVSRLIMKIWNQKTLQLDLTLTLLKNANPILQSHLRIVHLRTKKARKFWLNLWWPHTWIWNGKVWKAGGTDIACGFFWHLAFAWR